MEEIVLACEQAIEGLKASEKLNDFEIDQLKSEYLGKKSELTSRFKSLKSVAPEERQAVGQLLNQVRQQLEELLQQAYKAVKQYEIDQALSVGVDVSIIARKTKKGSLHPLTLAYMEISEIFTSMGFDVVEGPEIETPYRNFFALNFPENHPAITMHDTFHLTEQELLLRTHTSTVQVHAMANHQPPLRIATPGKVYRCDHDATHSPMFNQVECLVIDEDCSFAQVKWLLLKLCEAYLGQSLEYRFRPSFFPFTEPSAELDIRWRGKWLEIAGCGMVHPNVLKEARIDTKKFKGFAFGVGIDRLAMLKYDISDLRVLYENHIDFLKQFGESV
ncbi:phenylalanine--tRNA ligase subunit alpha [Gammaproteobacteria bacterium]|nr:phenylalanine--tRNA ligase subunit alpha [Gammaproteobacteria bacterium]